MSSLVIAEHDNSSIKPSTLNTISAALACGGDVHLLVAGHNAAAAAAAGAQIAGVPRTKSADQVTLLEEEKITAYYGAGTLYATPERQEPII